MKLLSGCQVCLYDRLAIANRPGAYAHPTPAPAEIKIWPVITARFLGSFLERHAAARLAGLGILVCS